SSRGCNLGIVSLCQLFGFDAEDELLDPIEAALCLHKTVEREVHLLAIRNRNEEVPNSKRLMTAFQQVPKCKKIAFRLCHLLPVHEEVFVMHPETHERFAGDGFTLRDLVFVMRKNVVDAATVDVQRLTELFHRHRGTFEMPARTAGPKRSLPSRFLCI